MSSYRDDMNDTAIASDSTWLGLRTIAESTARIRDVLITGLAVMLLDGAVASDGIIDKVRPLLTEQAAVSDQVLDAAHLRGLVIERARAQDVLLGSTRALIEEGATAADQLLPARVRALVVERANVQDLVLGQRHARQLVAERANAGDQLVALQRQVVEDGVHALDLVLGRARAHSLVPEHANATDEILDGVKSAPLVLVERARAADEAFGQLHARDMVADAAAVAWDEVIQSGQDLGQAWTADAGGAWPMSRYAPFAATGLAVIDGTVYAMAPDGVYALDGDGETVQAELRTGLIDMSGQALALPVESHIEYELAGTATMAVTQTQSGQRKTYTYPLRGRPVADALTNARFEFGRGLLGRHFAYTLRLTGQHAYINDWTVLAATSKRSI
jgi:hypothetical protein